MSKELYQGPLWWRRVVEYTTWPCSWYCGGFLPASFCTSSNPNNFDEILEQIPTTVIDDMNRHLTEEFIAQEVELALKHMAPLKSPGLDGMPPLFLSKLLVFGRKWCYWGYLNLFKFGYSPKFITFIPQVKNPEYVSQYRLISLSNVLYKLFSKVLANRLRKILPHLISEHQSAFMMEHLISDNIMVAFETLHYIRNHSTGNIGYMALELDISKTYDQVEWEYMETLIKKKGICWYLDKINDGVCFYSNLLGFDQWRNTWAYYTN